MAKVKVTSELVAEEFLKWIENKKGNLIYWRGNYFTWVTTHYSAISNDEIDVYATKFQKQFVDELREQKTEFSISNRLSQAGVHRLIKAGAHVPEEVELNSFLGENKSATGLVSFANGVLNVTDLEALRTYRLEPHSPKLFNLKSIPHPLIRGATCDTFQSFLADVLPDSADRLQLQEAFGYALLPDCRFQRMFVLVGGGSNGKGVVSLLLRLTLGEANVGSVSLEGIDPKRTFQLASLLDKFANVIEDVSDVCKVSEGTLKQIVAGEPILIEKKFGDPFPARLTAKWIISANNLPRFSDRTEGIFRRLRIIPFEKNFPEGSRREEFVSSEFWLKSGEVPGVLEWAVKGLERLLEQRRFTSSTNSENSLLLYRMDTNPAAAFLDDYVEARTGGELPSAELYASYSSWCDRNGYKALGASSFSKEVRRRLPEAQLSQHPRVWGGTRTRVWSGIQLLPSFDSQADGRLRAVNKVE